MFSPHTHHVLNGTAEAAAKNVNTLLLTQHKQCDIHWHTNRHSRGMAASLPSQYGRIGVAPSA